MLKKVIIKNFKRWKDKTIEFHPQSISLLIGGNNSGKSSILQALSLWAFCKVVIENEKGPECLYNHAKVNGVGLNIDDFSPINIPNLMHLWTGVSTDGKYTLSIECFWDDGAGHEKHLGFSLALVQERLFIKTTKTNLNADDKIPNIVLLTPFAGIEVREAQLSPAVRSRLIGKGLPGSVLRNEIIDLYNKNIALREEKRGGRPKIKESDLKYIRENDPYEILQKVLFDVFQLQLYPERFNPAFHSYLRVNLKRGRIEKNRFSPFPKFKARDIMTEGSGFLQWLSVFTYALSPNIDILLLDEPDAHLHPSLQYDLFSHLSRFSVKTNKQIIVATHSSEIIKRWPLHDIIWINASSVDYIHHEHQRMAALNNIGSEYCPRIDKIKANKRILFCENEQDAEYLKIWCSTLGLTWPTNIVVWGTTAHHRERKLLHDHLAQEIPDLKSLSLLDRDYTDPGKIKSDLTISGEPDLPEALPTFFKRAWQRHEIESYMLHPTAIARTIAKKRVGIDIITIEQEVKNFFSTKFGVVFNAGFTSNIRSIEIATLFDLDGHQTLDILTRHFGIKDIDIVRSMKADEIFEDVKILLNEICRGGMI